MRLTINLRDNALASIKQTAERRDVTLEEVIRRGIALIALADRIQSEGGKILTQKADGTQQELTNLFTDI